METLTSKWDDGDAPFDVPRHHLRRSDRVALDDPDRWRAALPGGVEAVFFFGDSFESQQFARSVRDTFVSEYGLHQSDVPLMQMGLWPGVTTPFRLVL